MTRRDLGPAALLGMGSGWNLRAFAQEAAPAERSGAGKPARPDPVTGYVADFIVNTRHTDVSGEVMELAKKSVLDGLGLALCGSVARSGEIVRKYLQSNGL